MKRRYLRLGLPIGAGHRLKCALIKSGYLEQATVPFEHTHKAVLGLTKRARSELGLDEDASKDQAFASGGGRASIPHRYWQRWWARHLTSLGYTTAIEASRSANERDGRFDVLSKRNGTLIAIEIETGKSDVESNIRRGLRANADRVIVVAPNEDAMSRLETRLSSAGLLIPCRVDLTLRDRVPDGL